MGDGDDADGGGTWMTYRELAAARGIKHAAAIRLVQRNRWPKREGSNDGLAHVLVPPDALRAPPPVVRSRRPATPPDMTPPDTAARGLLAGALTALESAVAGLREANEAKDREIVTLQSNVARAEGRADRLERDLAAALNVADDARTAARKAEDAAEALRQADAARRARGRWARLRAAWRGA